MKFRVAGLQMNSTPDVHANLAQAHGLILAALERKADMIVLPEMFVSLGGALHPSQSPNDYWVETLQEWAAEYGIWLVGGSLPIRPTSKSKKLVNRCYVFDPDGEEVACYDKLHLFDASVALPGSPQAAGLGGRSGTSLTAGAPLGLGPVVQNVQAFSESVEFRAGKTPVSFDSPVGRIGIAICYDLRFPELFKWYALQGCQAVVMPSAFTHVTGQMHWDVLTRARAIENGIYLVASNQWGVHATQPAHRESYGHSRVVDPLGRVLAERPGGNGIVFADLDPSRVRDAQERIPTLQSTRFKIREPQAK